MLYIKNNLKYALTFKCEKDGRTRKFDFDCRRIYRDTGNVATTGVTPIAEEDFDLLYNGVSVFKAHIDKGLLEKTKESGATTMASQVDALEKENAILKEQLAKKTKEASTATNEEIEKTKEENADLKTQLESMKKKSSKKTAKVDESEGF